MSKIIYSLTPVSTEITGGAKVYRANVQTNGTITQDQLASVLAEKTKQDKSLVQYFLLALNEEMERQILAGYRVNLGQLSTDFAIKGAFMSEDDRFDAARHTLVATVRTLDPLKSALAAVGAENITVGLACTVGSLMDTVTKETNAITGTHEVHIQGVNLGISPDNPDEGVTLVDDTGAIKAPVPLAVSTDGTLKVMTAKADGSDWGFTGSGFQTWTSGQRGIPMIEYIFGDERVSVDDFIVSADGTSFRPTDEMIAACLVNLGDLGACDGTAMIRFVPGPDTASEVLSVPVRYNPA